MKSKSLLVILIFATQQVFFAQTYVPGKSYFSNNDYVEYIVGNSPFILSAPHGGDLKPSTIPDRTCAACVTVQDGFTQELARDIYNAFYKKTGCYPHVIISRLHRIKLDPNREIVEAAQGNPLAEAAWNAFQGYIKTAKSQVTQQFGKGFYIDLHGHGHTKQRLELGYLLTASELQLSDSQLNTKKYADYSSIRNLVLKNTQQLQHTDFLRGKNAFGTLLTNSGFPSVPSLQDPFPLTGDDYFNGGYNTLQHGSNLSGSIDGVQIESNYIGVRDKDTNRKKFADSLSSVVQKMSENNYFGKNFSFCKKIATQDAQGKEVLLFQNPSQGWLSIQNGQTGGELFIYDLNGHLQKKAILDSPIFQLDCSDLANGFYLLKYEGKVYKWLKM